MFGSIGGAELVLVLVLALLLFGPRKLPQIGRKLGDALAQFRKATHDFKSTLESEVEMEEVRSARRELTSAVDEVRGQGPARGTLAEPTTPPTRPAETPTAPSPDAGDRTQD